MTDATRAPRERPLSPHTSIWRWHITMAASIATRITGVGLYLGALILAAWAISLASGPEAYATFKGVMGSFLGKVVLFGMTLSFFYHLAAGVRHIVWDLGHALTVRQANAFSVASFAFAGAATIAVWVIAGLIGAL
ncbi:succinate dehydrogenase, cytochrome b556 subunit [Phenylobacterium sp.]|jgi:succinate dehydrogenase / fumarate reductase cytochrome b subunit|uniref:succinate dehydrogenase, cytochrome b556 subunit n=1 Tax=Phenylobacterium sp. TaxID=1871053 RepID=UPI002F94E06C